jgi:hemoglobin
MKRKESMLSALPIVVSPYERLGGSENIDAVVADLYQRILSDPTLKPIFANNDTDHLRRHQVKFIIYALGGPNQYSGRSMRRAHEGLGISEGQFGAVAGHLSVSLSSGRREPHMRRDGPQARASGTVCFVSGRDLISSGRIIL